MSKKLNPWVKFLKSKDSKECYDKYKELDPQSKRFSRDYKERRLRVQQMNEQERKRVEGVAKINEQAKKEEEFKKQQEFKKLTERLYKFLEDATPVDRNGMMGSGLSSYVYRDIEKIVNKLNPRLKFNDEGVERYTVGMSTKLLKSFNTVDKLKKLLNELEKIKIPETVKNPPKYTIRRRSPYTRP